MPPELLLFHWNRITRLVRHAQHFQVKSPGIVYNNLILPKLSLFKTLSLSLLVKHNNWICIANNHNPLLVCALSPTLFISVSFPHLFPTQIGNCFRATTATITPGKGQISRSKGKPECLYDHCHSCNFFLPLSPVSILDFIFSETSLSLFCFHCETYNVALMITI